MVVRVGVVVVVVIVGVVVVVVVVAVAVVVVVVTFLEDVPWSACFVEPPSPLRFVPLEDSSSALRTEGPAGSFVPEVVVVVVVVVEEEPPLVALLEVNAPAVVAFSFRVETLPVAVESVLVLAVGGFDVDVADADVDWGTLDAVLFPASFRSTALGSAVVVVVLATS